MPYCWSIALRGQQLQVVALILEAGVVPAHNRLQDAPTCPVRVVRQLRHALGEFLVRMCKVRQDGACVAGAPGDVVPRVIRVDDGEPVVVFVSKVRHLMLQWPKRYG